MTQQVEALLTEHLRYTPLSLIDDIINTVNTIVYRAIEAIENGLFSIPPQQLGYNPDSDTSRDASTLTDPDHPEATAEIENGVHQLETLLEATVDKTFDKFEIYALRNILTVDDRMVPWMRLGHYEGLTLPLPPKTPTPDSLLALRRKLKETRKLNLALRAAHARNAATIAQLRSFLSPPNTTTTTTNTANTYASSPHQPDKSLAFLTSHPSAAQLGISPFTTTSTSTTPPTNPSSSTTTNARKEPLTQQTSFFLSQLPALRAALSTLRPRLASLPAKIGDVDWESRREERRGFIEGRVRRVVGDVVVGDEGNGGLDVGMGMGRVGREDVVGLEGVVRGMSRGGEGEEGRMEVDG